MARTRPPRSEHPRRAPTAPSGTPDREHQRDGRQQQPDRAAQHDTGIVFGFHAAVAALAGGRRPIHAVHATAAAAAKLAPAIAARGLEPTIVTAEELTRRLGPNAVHQGIMLRAGAVEPIDIHDIETRSGIVLVLDQITDPHNVGAILRTAAAFAVDAVVTTTRHTPALAGIVAKAASGGLDHVAIAEVVNLARALDTLGEMGYLRVGLDSEGSANFDAVPPRPPVALVLGAEDKGLRRLTRERCDALMRLDMPGAIKSLNVSNACAVALTLLDQKLRSSRQDALAR